MKWLVLVIMIFLVAALVERAWRPDERPVTYAPSLPARPAPAVTAPPSAGVGGPRPEVTAVAPPAPPPPAKIEAPFVVDGVVRPLPFVLNTETGPPASSPAYPVNGQIGELVTPPAKPTAPGAP